MRLSFDKKILYGFLGCTLILFAVTLTTFRNSGELTEQRAWVIHTHEVIHEFDQILVAATNAEAAVRGYLISGSADFLAPFREARLKTFHHVERAARLTSDNSQQQYNIERMRLLSQDHYSLLDTCIQLQARTPAQAMKLVASGQTKRILDEIRLTVTSAKSIEDRLLGEREIASEAQTSSFRWQFTGLVIVTAAMLTVIYFIITANVRRLRKLQTEADAKNWSLEGSTRLMHVVQGNKSPEQVGQAIVDHLTSYLDLPIGAIYLAENDDRLRLIGGHALAKRDTDTVTVSFGEGITGQAALEKRTIILHDVRPQYFMVATAFGQIRPATIIALPLIVEERLMGVIELGSLNKFSDVQQRYLEFISPGIAVAMLSARMRLETRELLEETQRQSEELESQQMELKQTNEELHSKTEMLERNETEMRAQQTQLQQVNVELEEKANMLEEQKEILEKAMASLELKSQELETAGRYKSEFLANMSHELRTPLNSILILSQLLTENKSGSMMLKELEYAKNINNAGEDLLNLINELLDLARIEAGKMQLEISEVPVQEIMNDVLAVFAEMANKNAVRFSIQCPADVASKVITTDKQRVEQILKNLLSNAFKFTSPQGSITLEVSSEIRPAGGPALSFSVTDTGIGIPQDKLEIIFQAFQQVDGSTKRRYGGTGLGLSISKELAHALGGTLEVQSEEGKGSVFTFTVPMLFDQNAGAPIEKIVELRRPASERRSPEKSPQPLPPRNGIADDRDGISERDKVIMIVEDDRDFAKVLLDFVRERGYKGIVAAQGLEGLTLARHFQPEAIFLDLNLPVMDGIELLKQLKSDLGLRHIPVQIISALDEKKKGLELGAFDYLKKPVSTTGLQKAFDKIESFKNRKLKRLLIVEDNESQNNAIRELIGNGDVKCTSAYRGMEAYDLLQQDTFDCLILDLGLPDISGFELLEKMKASDRLNKIPVIVYTARDLKRDEVSRLNKLANTVILKTADSKERLLDETTLFLHRVESRMPKEKQSILRKLHRADEVLKNKKILLVDDDIRNIYSLSNALEDEEMVCVTAENGREAIEVLNANPDVGLVLMDIMMPEMDGYEATAAIRSIDQFRKLPIIALTAKAMKGDKEKCLAAGMSDYISKPVNMEQLLSLMRVWLYK